MSKKEEQSLTPRQEHTARENAQKQLLEFIGLTPSDYTHLSFTKEEVTNIRKYMAHLSTGAVAAIPLKCVGSQCPFKDQCPLFEIKKLPVGKPCQPPGSLVLTAKRGYIPIEELDPRKDKVVSFILGHNAIRSKGASFKRGSRFYNGEMIRISAGAYSYDCTKDHICIAAWNEKAKDLFAVYLMQKGDFWRVGKTRLHCRLKNGHNHSGLAMRGRGEKADRMWLLGVYKTNVEATLAEEWFSIEGQISKTCFIEHKNKCKKWNGLYRWVDQEELDAHHRRLAKDRQHYEKFLERLGLSIDYPVWVYHDHEEGQSNRYGAIGIAMKIRACNVLPEYMDVPVVEKLEKRKGTKSPVFKTANVERYHYEGLVYNLDVEKWHTYITGGIITSNCFLESQLLMNWRRTYVLEYDVDPNNFTELGLVNDLAEIELLNWRLNNNLAKAEFADLLQEETVAVDREGNVLTKKTVSPLLEMKEKLSNRRSRIIKSLVGDREGQYKREAALKIRTSEDSSTSMADLRRLLEKVAAQHKQLTQQTEAEERENKLERLEEPVQVTPDDMISRLLEDEEE